MKKNHQTKPPRMLSSARCIALIMVTIATIVLGYTIIKNIGGDASKLIPIERADEDFFTSRATPVDVLPRLHPVLIYQCRDDGNYFCCAGTVYENTSGQKALITAEHLFRSEVSAGGIYGIRYLRPASVHITEFVEKVVKTSSELENNDIVTANLGFKKTFINNFSKFTGNKSTGNRFRFDLKVDGKPVTRLRSLLSGEYTQVLGAMEASSPGMKTKMYVLMNYAALDGESGSGFIDDYGGLYVVHGSFNKGQEGTSEVVKIYSNVIGTNALKGFTLLSGPVGFRK